MRSLLTHFVKLTSAVLIKLGRSHSYLIDSFLEGRDFKLSSRKRFFRAVEKTSGENSCWWSQQFHAWQDWYTRRRNCTKKRYSYSKRLRTLILITTGRHQRNRIKSRSSTGTRTWWNIDCTSTIAATESRQKWNTIPTKPYVGQISALEKFALHKHPLQLGGTINNDLYLLSFLAVIPMMWSTLDLVICSI